MAMLKRSLGIAWIALAFATVAPVTTASASTAASESAAASEWVVAGYYYGIDIYNRCHRDGVRTGRGYECLYYSSSMGGEAHYELWIFV